MNCNHATGQTECQQCHPLWPLPPLWRFYEAAEDIGNQLPVRLCNQPPERLVDLRKSRFPADYISIIKTLSSTK